MDKKKLARVIATWVVTSVMLSVFILDIVVVSLANKYVSQVNIEDHNFNNISGDDKIHFLDTANSDCILIESNGHFVLVDSGEGNENPRRKTEYKGYLEEVLSYIKKVATKDDGKAHLDFIVATHMHYDHSGNFEAIISNDSIIIDKAFIKDYDGSLTSSMDSEKWGNKQTYEKIIDSMENGNFYCASGKNPPAINALYVEDNVIKIDCSPAADIFINGYCRGFRHINGEDITHAEFRLRPEDIFFRITVRDKFGNNAHTHYYKVEDFYKE
jgi:hypothetical protein